MVVVVKEKEEQWAQMVERCRRVVDKLGQPIDEGIFETVVVLNLLGIHTSASCEGHLNWGAYAPWIDIQTPGAEEKNAMFSKAHASYNKEVEAKELSHVELRQLYIQNCQLEREADEKILGERSNLMNYLIRFYENRHSAHDRILTLQHRSYSARLESQGARFQWIATDERRVQKLIEYQEEMQAFTAFLKEQFFGEVDKK